MKVIQLEFIQELSRQFRLVHTAMFDNHNVRSGVQDFYDNVIPQQVSTKASRLLNESLELTKADVYPTNAEQLMSSPPPKTASQLMRAIQKYRIEKDQDIKQVLTYIWRTQGGALQIQLQVHLVCKTLLDLQLLTADHFVTNSVEVPTDSASGMMTEVRRKRERTSGARAGQGRRWMGSEGDSTVDARPGPGFRLHCTWYTWSNMK